MNFISTQHNWDGNAVIQHEAGLALSFDQVGKSFGAREVLQDLNLSIGAGEFVAIMGPSGCGKSTLLRIVAGEVRPVTAKVTVPALVRGDELITETGSIRHAVNAAKAIEQSPDGLSAAMMWGNPFTDVPALASNSFVVTDNDDNIDALNPKSTSRCGNRRPSAKAAQASPIAAQVWIP